MKRKIAAVLAALILLLAGCTKAVGGTYKLARGTAEGKSWSAESLGMNFSFTLEDDGIGHGQYNSQIVDLIWSESGNTVTVEGKFGTLEFTKSGKNLLLHDNGSVLVFEPYTETESESK